MDRYAKWMILSSVVVFCAAGASFGQGGRTAGGRAASEAGLKEPRFHKPMSTSRALDFNWGKYLGLNDPQYVQLQDVLQRRHEAVAPLMDRRDEALGGLRALAVNERAEAKAAESAWKSYAEAQRQMLEQRLRLWEETAGFLTPSQRARLITRFIGR